MARPSRYVPGGFGRTGPGVGGMETSRAQRVLSGAVSYCHSMGYCSYPSRKGRTGYPSHAHCASSRKSSSLGWLSSQHCQWRGYVLHPQDFLAIIFIIAGSVYQQGCIRQGLHSVGPLEEPIPSEEGLLPIVIWSGDSKRAGKQTRADLPGRFCYYKAV